MQQSMVQRHHDDVSLQLELSGDEFTLRRFMSHQEETDEKLPMQPFRMLSRGCTACPRPYEDRR